MIPHKTNTSLVGGGKISVEQYRIIKLWQGFTAAGKVIKALWLRYVVWKVHSIAVTCIHKWKEKAVWNLLKWLLQCKTTRTNAVNNTVDLHAPPNFETRCIKY